MPKTDSSFEEWSTAFQEAINTENTQLIKQLLASLPQCETEVQMRQMLLQTMDAETMICKIRQQLYDLRSDIAAKTSR